MQNAAQRTTGGERATRHPDAISPPTITSRAEIAHLATAAARTNLSVGEAGLAGLLLEVAVTASRPDGDEAGLVRLIDTTLRTLAGRPDTLAERRFLEAARDHLSAPRERPMRDVRSHHDHGDLTHSG